MIGTQSRLPCLDAQLGEAVLLENQSEPTKFKTRIGLPCGFFYCVYILGGA
jgi:hypothetical protein